MENRIDLFTIFGFTIRLHRSWIFLALLIAWSLAVGYFPEAQEGLSTKTYWLMGLFGVLGLFISIIIHELFHSLVARRYGMPMKGITLFIFGGIAEMGEEPTSPKAEGYMAIVGPLASLALWVIFGGVAMLADAQGWPAAVTTVAAYLSAINLILAIFNMIPAFPLDGGRVLRAILWHVKGDYRWATLWSSRIGRGFGILLIALGIVSLIGGQFVGGVWWVLIGLFLTYVAQSSYSQALVKEHLKSESVMRFVSPDVPRLSPQTSLAETVDQYFYRHRNKLFPVVLGEDLVGCVRAEDVRKVPQADRESSSVDQVMEPCNEELTVSPNVNAYEAYTKMITSKRTELLVVDQGRLVGVLRLNDLLEFLSVKLDIEEGHSAHPRRV